MQAVWVFPQESASFYFKDQVFVAFKIYQVVFHDIFNCFFGDGYPDDVEVFDFAAFFPDVLDCKFILELIPILRVEGDWNLQSGKIKFQGPEDQIKIIKDKIYM